MQAHTVAARTPLDESVVDILRAEFSRPACFSRAMSDTTMRAPFTTA